MKQKKFLKVFLLFGILAMVTCSLPYPDESDQSSSQNNDNSQKVTGLRILSFFQSAVEVQTGGNIQFSVKVNQPLSSGLSYIWTCPSGIFSNQMLLGTSEYTESKIVWTASINEAQSLMIRVSIQENKQEIAYQEFLPVFVYDDTTLKNSNPQFSIPPGIYDSAQTILIGSNTPGAIIRYTTDGSDPVVSKTAVQSYTVTVYKSTILKAVAFQANYRNSDVITGEYQISNIPSDNAYLANLYVSPAGVDPLFSHDIDVYRNWIPADTTEVTIIPLTEDPKAKIFYVKLNGTDLMGDGIYVAKPLNEGENPVQIKIQAQDGLHYKEYYLTIIKGMHKNNPPELAPIGNKTVAENNKLEFIVNAVDPDNDPLTYKAINLPLGAVFNPETHLFSWTPGFNQAGIYTDIHFEVSDAEYTVSEIIQITVNDTCDANAWKCGKIYERGDIVCYGGIKYKCRLCHLSLSSLAPSSCYLLWSKVFLGDYSEWTVQTEYSCGNIVTYKDHVYRCILSHVADCSELTPDRTPILWKKIA